MRTAKRFRSLSMTALLGLAVVACSKKDDAKIPDTNPTTVLKESTQLFSRIAGEDSAGQPAAAPEEAASAFVESHGWIDAEKTVIDDSTIGAVANFTNHHGTRKISRIAGRIVLFNDEGKDLGQVPFSTRGSLAAKQTKQLVVVSGKPKISFEKAKVLVTEAEFAL